MQDSLLKNKRKYEDTKSELLPSSINFLLLKVSQSFGSNSLLLEFQDEMEITKNFRLGYCTLKGINQPRIGIASSIRQGSHELDFHMTRYLALKCMYYFNLEIKNFTTSEPHRFQK